MTEEKNAKEKPKISFETESDLNETITQVASNLSELCHSDEHLEPYVHGINQMFEFFKDVYRRNVKLLETVQDLNTQIVVNASKVQMISQSTNEDKDSLSDLKNEFDEASRMVTFAHKAETKSKEVLTQLRSSIEVLSTQVNRGEAFCFGDENSIFEVSQDVKNLESECKKGREELDQFVRNIEEKKQSLEKVQTDIKEMKSDEEKMKKSISLIDKKLSTLTKDVTDTFDQLVELKPIIPSQKTELDSKVKEKTKIARNVVSLKQLHYESLSQLNQLKDESKGIKEKGGRRARLNAELNRIAHSRTERIETAKSRLVDSENSVRNLNIELDKIVKIGVDLKSQFDQLIQNTEILSSQKNEVRKMIREKRPKLVEMSFAISKTSNETQMDSRKVISQKISLTAQKGQYIQEINATAEAGNAGKQSKATIKNTKPILQDQKDKVVSYLKEIDSKMGEKYKILAQTQMAKENSELINIENQSQLSELKLLKEKSERQDSLSEERRNERNISKRMLEEKEAENHQLTIQNGQLNATINELENKFITMLRETGLDHLKCRRKLERIAGLESLVDEMKANIQSTERMVSRLQAEYQTLNHVLRDAQNDHLQQRKEHALLTNNQATIMQEMYAKDQKIETIRDQITSTEAYLKKCSNLYREKEAEIQALMTNLKTMEASTKELEKKLEKMAQLEYKMHRVVAATIVEKQKGMTLIHEFSIPRNVHRWQIIGAVDQQFAKNIQYRTEISAKIDAAHRELISLNEEKVKLREQLQKMKEKLNNINNSPLKSKDEVQTAINTYQDDLKRMDGELKEMKKLFEGNIPSTQKMDAKVAKARSSLTERRGNASLLKNEVTSTALMMSYEQNQIQSQFPNQLLNMNQKTFFITEDPLRNPFLGGGYNIDKMQAAKRAAVTRSQPKPLVGPSAPMSRNTRRYVSPLLQQAPNGMMPKQHLGINFRLPSME